MKKVLLLAAGAMAVAMSAAAEGPVIEEAQHSSNLTLEWYYSPAELGGGYDARAGIGTNGKFYVVKHCDGVYVFDKTGQIKKISDRNAWVSINCDDAGHVYYRNDVGGFPGPEGAGWFVTEAAQFSVIDAATDQVIKTNVPIDGGGKCRFDALPHIQGDMTSEFFELSAPVNATAQRVYNWIYNEGINSPNTFIEINIEPYFKSADFPTNEAGNSSASINTLANCQHYTLNDTDYMAVYPNANYEVSFANNGWGNCIGQMIFDEDNYKYEFTGKFYNTPNHSGVGGFHMFQYKGENYIVYPSGQQNVGMPSADGFAVMKEELVDVPTNEVPIPESDLAKTAAIKFGTDGLASGNNWRGINVEPVEGQDGLFTIYFYSPGASMQVWTLDLTTNGVESVASDSAIAAPVYYNLQGQRVANPAKGIYIEVRGNKAAKVLK